eukprot:jgi/Mesen1/10277/ME000789S09553
MWLGVGEMGIGGKGWDLERSPGATLRGRGWMQRGGGRAGPCLGCRKAYSLSVSPSRSFLLCRSLSFFISLCVCDSPHVCTIYTGWD